MGLVNAGMVKWPSMWFFAGTVGLMVSAAWGISGAHDPGKCYYINEAEKIYITEHCVYEYRIAVSIRTMFLLPKQGIFLITR